uniref:Lipase, hepatic a n=1 Tax=Hucho hucho TaxID=62062 RepID=A0A4W5MFV0_9TELE
MSHITSTVFKLYSDGAKDKEDWCTVEAFIPHTRTSCGFNSSHPLIIITHGWSVRPVLSSPPGSTNAPNDLQWRARYHMVAIPSLCNPTNETKTSFSFSKINALMESWVPVLASALKTSLGDVNVIVTDWLLQANMNYPNASQNTRAVGKDIAFLLQWLQEFYQFPAEKVHLIGYSLSNGILVKSLRSFVFLCPGLDPVGPLFEGMAASDRLSPDDALFVDAIKQPVAHVGFYPNGGDFQPGCHPFQSLMEHIALHGINGFEQKVRCAHERSVYLFIDSLLNKDKQIMAYRCSDDNSFEKGTCLDCRKNKCNTLGYNVRRVRSAAGKKLYHNTRSHMPYKRKCTQWCPMSLTDKTHSSMYLGNTTYTFLITLDSDIGDLMMLKFCWEGSVVNKMWSKMQTFNPWSSGVMEPELTVGKICVKAGETQNSWVSIPLGGKEGVRLNCINKDQ